MPETPEQADLQTYPRPHVAVDLVIAALGPWAGPEHHDCLGVVVVDGPQGRHALPGRFVRERHTMHETVRELMVDELGFTSRSRLALTMLDVFDDPARDARGWVLAVAYSTALDTHAVRRLTARVVPVTGPATRGSVTTPEPLAFDHDQMVTTACRRMRRRYEKAPDPDRLLAPPYTLSQLRHAHEAVLGAPLKRDTFNRRMRDLLEPALDARGAETFTSESVGRPAQLFAPPRRSRPGPPPEPFPLPRS